VNNRRLTAKAAFDVTIQTVKARIQLTADKPERDENLYAVLPQTVVRLLRLAKDVQRFNAIMQHRLLS